MLSPSRSSSKGSTPSGAFRARPRVPRPSRPRHARARSRPLAVPLPARPRPTHRAGPRSRRGPREKAFARRADQDRQAQPMQRAHLRQQCRRLVRRLGEAESGVEHQPVAIDPRPNRRIDARLQLVEHVEQQIVIRRVGLHRLRIAAHMHQHHRHLRIARDIERVFVMRQRADVVEHRRTRVERGPHRRRVARVDRNRPVGRQRAQYRQHATQLFFDRHRFSPRPRRLAANVEQIGALRTQRPSLRDRRVGIEEPAAIRETVRRRVDDAHDQWPFARRESARLRQRRREIGIEFDRGHHARCRSALTQLGQGESQRSMSDGQRASHCDCVARRNTGEKAERANTHRHATKAGASPGSAASNAPIQRPVTG